MVQNYPGEDSNVSFLNIKKDKPWNAQERERYGLPVYIRVQIPVLYKGDLNAIADVLKGLSNQMKFMAQDANKSDLGAWLETKGLCREVNEKFATLRKKRPGL